MLSWNVKNFSIFIVSGMISLQAFASSGGKSGGSLLKKALLKNQLVSFLPTESEDTESDLKSLGWLANRSSLNPWGDFERLSITTLGMATDVDKALGLREFSPEELAAKEVSVNSRGMLVQPLGKGFGVRLESDVTYIYVMLQDGRIFATPEKEADSSLYGFVKVHHSALLSGLDKIRGPVAAGEFRVSKKGKISLINESSGHYAPSGRAALVLRELEARCGNKVSEASVEINYYEGDKVLKRFEPDLFGEAKLFEFLHSISPLSKNFGL